MRLVGAALAAAVCAATLGGCSDDGAGEPEASARASTTTTAAPITSTTSPATPAPTAWTVTEYEVPAGTHPHDVAVAADGTVWYTAQHTGKLGRLEPATGRTTEVDLGEGSAPHGVIVAADGVTPWITDSGLNAIVRVDPSTNEVTRFDLPTTHAGANLNTAAFDGDGVLWFTGQAGSYGRLDPATGGLDVFDAPKGRGPYGITVTPSNDVFYASLAGDHLARIDRATASATVLTPTTADNGTRRVWTDRRSRIWCSQWDSGQVALYDPHDGSWHEWKLPGARPQAYAVYVDERDAVWLTDFGANAIVRFDPTTQTFTSVPLPTNGSAVRQLHGRGDEVWGAASGVDKLVAVRPAAAGGG